MLKESPHGNRCICWPLLLALAIVIASSNPVVGPFANWVWQADKVIHFSVFGFMALLIARVRLIQRNTPWGAMTAVVIVLTATDLPTAATVRTLPARRIAPDPGGRDARPDRCSSLLHVARTRVRHHP